MASPIVDTKLFTPVPRGEVVPRHRLTARLDRSESARLVLLSAPPGFGKSTLLVDWLAADPVRRATTAWLSLDGADDEPGVFWRYVLAALETVVPDVAEVRAMLDAGDITTSAIVASLSNAIHAWGGRVSLVLDDYHVITASAIHDGLASFLDRAPVTCAVILSTRADPPLPLARLRARGELLEIRAADLRFTADEAHAYLNGPMGLALASGDVDSLEARTEGWIAALQLVALSLRGRTDPSAFIADFAGDDRYIVDYLMDEVLDRQPARIQAFLLATSILDRLSGPLCDAVTGSDDGRGILHALDRDNLFLIALDDRRVWYRYHHLFADVLRARLAHERPGDIPELHRRASVWFEQQGSESDAVRHALAAGDLDRAADLIEVAAHELRATRQEVTLRRWLDALPEGVFDTRPVIAIAHAGALLATGQTRGVERRLEQAERWSSAAHDDRSLADAVARGMVVRRPEVLSHLPSAIGLYRAGLARTRGDLTSTIEHARSVLDSTGNDQPLERGGAAGMLGLALWSAGELDAAHAAWSEAVVSLDRAGHTADILGCSIALADIRLTQGRLLDARRTYEHGLHLGEQAAGGPLRGVVDMRVGLAGLAVDRHELDEARRQLEAATALGGSLGLPQSAHRQLVVTGRLRWAEGDLDGAVAAFDEAQLRYDADMFPDVVPIAAMRARVLLVQGRLADAETWARDAAISPDEPGSFLREYEHATLARLLLARAARDPSGGSVDGALRFAEELLAAAEAGGRAGSMADILLVLARARAARGEEAGARDALSDALALAAPQGWVGPFRDEGAALVPLLRSVAQHDVAPFVRGLLGSTGSPQSRTSTRQPLIEPLSERELDVLRLLRSELDGPAIAGELHVSLNTLRTHTRNIYAKLGVHGRRAAIRTAADLDLF
ncbi:MAG: helix-turn-helix transcriptional regulator [Chloroflexi bacterium]|nr:helix-turn-helix transcriptional regulator [Chloroflexota bacterium]